MNSLQTLTVNRIETLLSNAGLQDLVEVKVETHLNQYDKKTPHIVAYTKNDLVVNVSDEVDETNTRNLVFSEDLSCKYEELNKYFSAEVFALGITQRADYIKAPLSDKVFCYHNNIHPARYEAPKVEVTEEVIAPRRRRNYKDGYQGKIDILNTLLEGAELMGDTKQINYYTRKLKYFNSRQAEYKIVNN